MSKFREAVGGIREHQRVVRFVEVSKEILYVVVVDTRHTISFFLVEFSREVYVVVVDTTHDVVLFCRGFEICTGSVLKCRG